jgi:hypothetical protein
VPGLCGIKGDAMKLLWFGRRPPVVVRAMPVLLVALIVAAIFAVLFKGSPVK